MRAALAPLKQPGFPQLALGYTVNELGNWLGEIALAVLVFDQTGSALATAALFLAMQFLPAFLAQGLVARVEVVGTKGGLPALYAAEGATFVLIAAIADDFLLAAVVALAALDGTLALAGRTFTRTAMAAVLSPKGMLREGNALVNIGFTASSALGPLLAGLVVAGIGAREALLLDAASFAIVALILLVSARSLPNVKAAPEPWRKRLREGLAYVADRPILRRLLTAQAAAFIFFAAVLPVEIVYAKETLDAGTSGYGLLLSAWGAGMVFGSLVFVGARRVGLPLLLLVSTVAIGAAYLVMGAAGTLAAACLAAVLGGAGNGVQWVALMSAIQTLTDDDYQARVVGLLESSGFAMPGIGFLLGGLAAYVLDPRATFVIAGGGVLLVVAVMAPLLWRTSWPQAAPAEVPPPAEPPIAAHGIHPQTADMREA
jgi:MFS family permease